jgi:hypothetical protein
LHVVPSADPRLDREQNPAPQVPNDGVDGPTPQAEPAENAAAQAPNRNETGNDEDNDGDVVAGPAVEASVTLAKTPCKWS